MGQTGAKIVPLGKTNQIFIITEHQTKNKKESIQRRKKIKKEKQ